MQACTTFINVYESLAPFLSLQELLSLLLVNRLCALSDARRNTLKRGVFAIQPHESASHAAQRLAGIRDCVRGISLLGYRNRSTGMWFVVDTLPSFPAVNLLRAPLLGCDSKTDPGTAMFQLKELDISGDERCHSNDLDLTFVAALPLLERLSIRHCIMPSTDIQLKPLARLNRLDLSYSTVFNMDALGTLQTLTHLNVTCCGLVEITPIVALTRLISLSIGFNHVLELRPLASLTNLQHLHLESIFAESFAPLENLTNLRSLNVSSAYHLGAESLTRLCMSLTRLEKLNVSMCGSGADPPHSLAFLSHLTRLRELDASSLGLTDISGLMPLLELVHLNLGQNRFDSLESIRGLVRLESLDVSYTLFRDLEPVAGLVRLRSLKAIHTKITSVIAVCGLMRLETLEVGQTNVADLGPLALLAGLKVLDLSKTRVEFVNALRQHTGLKELNLSGTRVVDLSILSRMKKLEKLEMLNMPNVGDVEFLAALEKLKRVS
ncbi:hypothetical protein HDU98_004632, partial [Podochytrium sp. JEL0797]